MIKDQPDISGVYVCYVNPEPTDLTQRHAKLKILLWFDGKWYYPLSDQKYRDTVYACVGPMPIMELEW